MKGKRHPHKLRADGQLKGLALVSIFGWPHRNYRPACERRTDPVQAVARRDPPHQADRAGCGMTELPPLDFIRGRISVATVHEPHCDCGAELAQWLEPLLAEVERLRSPEVTLPNGRLSPAEERVYRYLRDTDLSTKNIAEQLFVSENTVKSHAKGVHRKLGVTRRAQLRTTA
jgi:DNA-binding CsgD family transcriptional regulator